MRIAIATCIAVACIPGHAQVTVPSPAKVLPGVEVSAAPIPGLSPVPGLSRVHEIRRLRLLELVRRHPDRLAMSSAGELVVRGELLAQPSDQEALERLRHAGFRVRSQHDIVDLGMVVVVLEPPPSLGLASALRRLRRLDPSGQYDYHHVYLDGASAYVPAAPHGGLPVAAGEPLTDRVRARRMRIGLIDAGVAVDHPRLAGARLSTSGCGDGRRVPSAHGTAVASVLLVAAVTTAQARPADVEIAAVDVYCDEPTGGSVVRVAEALGALARERIAVINVSLVGPRNGLLERATAAMVARGHVIVAAVGNDGPAAPPLYPAAYPGVVGVTAVDHTRRVIVEAGRGPAVDFAALGADVDAAALPVGATRVRGTSFAAPVVAGMLASRLAEPFPTDAVRAVDELVVLAVDLGRKGRDTVYGHGLLDCGSPQALDPAPVR